MYLGKTDSLYPGWNFSEVKSDIQHTDGTEHHIWKDSNISYIVQDHSYGQQALVDALSMVASIKSSGHTKIIANFCG